MLSSTNCFGYSIPLVFLLNIIAGHSSANINYDDEESPPQLPISIYRSNEFKSRNFNKENLELAPGINYHDYSSRSQLFKRFTKRDKEILSERLKKECGLSYSTSPYISNGIEESAARFPSFVYLETPPIGSKGCGGTILDSTHILTGSRCYSRAYRPTNTKVTTFYAEAGDWLRQERYVIQVCMIHSFNDFAYMGTDLVVMELEEPLKFNENVQSACLPEKQSVISEKNLAYLLGRGLYEPESELLAKLHSWPVQETYCQREENVVRNKRKCFTGYNETYNGNACDGDDGGGIIAIENGKHVVYGVLSIRDNPECKKGISGTIQAIDTFTYKDKILELMWKCTTQRD